MNTEIYYPKSGKTVGAGTQTNKSYTSPANGEGSIIYLAAYLPNSTSGFFPSYIVNVYINNVEILKYEGTNTYNSGMSMVQNSVVNVLSPKKFYAVTGSQNSGEQYAVYEGHCGFPVDKDGNPYLMLAPGDTVNITCTNGASVCITALEL